MAMSVIYLGLLGASLAAAVMNGTASLLTAAALEGAQSGVTLTLSMAGAVCLWSGLARVMEVSGLMGKLSRLFFPVLRRLFPDAAKEPGIMESLSGNLSANLLGLGNAATPLGIETARRMQAQSGSRIAGNDLCLLAVMNSASLQLIPATVGALRASMGSRSAFEILPAVWLSSACSVSAGIVSAKLLEKRL